MPTYQPCTQALTRKIALHTSVIHTDQWSSVTWSESQGYFTPPPRSLSLATQVVVTFIHAQRQWDEPIDANDCVQFINNVNMHAPPIITTHYWFICMSTISQILAIQNNMSKLNKIIKKIIIKIRENVLTNENRIFYQTRC